MSVAAITAICWSIAQRFRDTVYRSATVHMQGFEYGKPGHTLCGIAYGPSWTYEAGDYPPALFDGCKRCQAAYKAWKRRQVTGKQDA